MNYLHALNIFDADLNPSTAIYKGYEYIDDVILDINKPTNNDFLKVIEENGFKLGIPSHNAYGNYGLYIPKTELDEKTK
ncbi:MAG: hypothetical protein H0W89_06770 [Candidatus Levybacteria bacterium]|nr:hypothetical protein [Candidatus Levybacteria bacterium]